MYLCVCECVCALLLKANREPMQIASFSSNNQSAELPSPTLILVLIWFRCQLAWPTCLPACLSVCVSVSVDCLPGISYEIDKLGLKFGVNKAVCGRCVCVWGNLAILLTKSNAIVLNSLQTVRYCAYRSALCICITQFTLAT